MGNSQRCWSIEPMRKVPVQRQFYCIILAVAECCKFAMICLKWIPNSCSQWNKLIIFHRVFATDLLSLLFLLLFWNRTNATREENREAIINDSIAYGIFMTLTAILQFITGIFSVDLFNYTALKQITRIRIRFFQSLMRQEIGWYDVTSGNNFAVRITE